MENPTITAKMIASKVQFMKESDLLKVLNGTYIAERFFGKSGCWFSQKSITMRRMVNR